MRALPAPSHARARQRGMSIVEIMVGLVIGLIATAVIFQTFSVAESFKRNTTSAGDAQQNGLFSTFTLALELANAGNGLASAAQSLSACPNTGDVTTTLRPIPVVIKGDPKDDVPDSFVVMYSASSTIVYPALFTSGAAAGTDYFVQSPTGFKKNDMIVAVNEGAGTCARTKVNTVSAPDAATGIVDIAHTGAAQSFDASSVLVNFGPWGSNQRVQYDVLNGVLRSTDLTPSDPKAAAPDAAPVPIASNIVNLKVQYGVDTDNDGLLDTWVKASDNGWAPADVLAGTLAQINQVKAIRIGFIVQSAQYERDIVSALPDSKGVFNWVLFDCATHDNTCPGRLTGSIGPDKNNGGYRYRVFETVVPLRNELWNRQS